MTVTTDAYALVETLAPYAERAEVRWMSVEDATIEMPARLVAEIGRVLPDLAASAGATVAPDAWKDEQGTLRGYEQGDDPWDALDRLGFIYACLPDEQKPHRSVALEALRLAESQIERAQSAELARDEAWFERVETVLANGAKDYVVWCRRCGVNHQCPEHCPARTSGPDWSKCDCGAGPYGIHARHCALAGDGGGVCHECGHAIHRPSRCSGGAVPSYACPCTAGDGGGADTPAVEYSYLVERVHEGSPVWMKHDATWTSDATEARRFVSQEEAGRVIAATRSAARVVEHGFDALAGDGGGA